MLKGVPISSDENGVGWLIIVDRQTEVFKEITLMMSEN